MPYQHCSNFPDITLEKPRANIEQKEKIGRDTVIIHVSKSSAHPEI